MNGTKIYERKLIDYDELKAHLEERVGYFNMKLQLDLEDNETSSDDCALTLGELFAYEDLLNKIRNIPF